MACDELDEVKTVESDRVRTAGLTMRIDFIRLVAKKRADRHHINGVINADDIDDVDRQSPRRVVRATAFCLGVANIMC
ncbi:MAG: hypothetical protein GY822_18425 [Deltaproteobacteria bacterium]|nr:hypothetical protein [Deltaproteobacteria bacterium]